MKIIIKLKPTKEAVDFLNSIDIFSLPVELVNNSGLEITIKGNFFLSFTGLSLWIENEEESLLRVPMNIIRDFVCKENK